MRGIGMRVWGGGGVEEGRGSYIILYVHRAESFGV